MKLDMRKKQETKESTKVTKKRYGMKELCMWKNSIRIFCSQKMEKYIIFMERK